MQEVFEKIIEELEENQTIVFNLGGGKPKQSIDLEKAIEIVKQEAEQYNNGWVPCSEPPKTGEYVLLSFENFSVPMVGRYEENEQGGAYYIGDEDEACIKQGIFVNAWQPLPEPYLPVSNDSTDAGTRYEKSAWRALILRNFMRGSDA